MSYGPNTAAVLRPRQACWPGLGCAAAQHGFFTLFFKASQRSEGFVAGRNGRSPCQLVSAGGLALALALHGKEAAPEGLNQHGARPREVRRGVHGAGGL